jgi:hypothetical protein
MQNQPANPEIDLCPWAAYDLGHQAQILRREQVDQWTIIIPRAKAGEKIDTSFWLSIYNMRRALRILARADQVQASILVELHQALNSFNATNERLAEFLQDADLTLPCPFGLEEWREVVSLAKVLLPDSSKLWLWSRLGAILGACQLLLSQQPAIERATLAEGLKELPKVISKLCSGGSYPFLREVTRFAEGVSNPAPVAPQTGDEKSPEHWHLQLADLDQLIKSALREEQVPEPQLVLTKDYLILFGERSDIKSVFKNQISCLWVLAENAGRPVPHKTIIDEGKMDLERWASSLRSVVKRLRDKILKPLIKLYRDREPGRELPGEKDAFIVVSPIESHSQQKGTYTLFLDASRVKVVGPRPWWMKSAPPR